MISFKLPEEILRTYTARHTNGLPHVRKLQNITNKLSFVKHNNLKFKDPTTVRKLQIMLIY